MQHYLIHYGSKKKELEELLNNYIKKHIAYELLCPIGNFFNDASFHLTVNYNNKLFELENYDYMNYKIMDIIEKNEENFYCSSYNPRGYSVRRL